LVALDNHPNGGQPTVDIMFHRGKTGPNATDVTPLPIGFTPDNASPNTFSEWEARRNDPYMSGWTVTNLGTRNGGLRGDVIISWFKPLDATNDDANLVDDQLYFMIVNGFAGPDGMAADYRQRITVNFFNNVTPSLQRINPETGEAEAILLEVIPGTGGRRRLNLELDGGKGELFKFNTGHAFLGTNFGLSGDFNGDGNVDAADYVTWRKGLGTVYNAAAYDVWRRNFGASSALGSAVIVPAGMSSVVPEPAATILMAHTMFVVTAFCYARRRRY
jgi:hypothetical protein